MSIIFFFQIFKKEKKITFKPETTINESQTDLIEGIQYFSKDVNGNTYLIESISGSLDKENPDIIYLVDVKAKINFDKNDEIKVTSDKAIYNVNNFDTEFINNVKLSYEDNKLSCRNILVKFSENYAILSGNLVYNNLLTKLYADRMEVDLISRITKTSMINQEDKIKMIHKNNGIN
ncbi:hypothetical protein OA346_01470 [Candidatus Pelagibacter sp.]|nr:hypothetical protein [Candidatus Pelagibacter sp.]